MKQVLLGYLRVPESPDAPLDVVLNPCGAERRAERRIWNNGDQRIKLVRSRHTATAPLAAALLGQENALPARRCAPDPQLRLRRGLCVEVHVDFYKRPEF